MNKEKLKELITVLKDITAELESEVYSDLSQYASDHEKQKVTYGDQIEEL